MKPQEYYIIEFAVKLAETLKESQSSTALFFVQQSFPDDINGLDQMSSNDLLDNIITNGKLYLAEVEQPKGLTDRTAKLEELVKVYEELVSNLTIQLVTPEPTTHKADLQLKILREYESELRKRIEEISINLK